MNKEEILNKFKTGDKPTGKDFSDLIEYCYNKLADTLDSDSTEDAVTAAKAKELNLKIESIKDRVEKIEYNPISGNKKMKSKQKFDYTKITPGRIDVNTGVVGASSGYTTTDFIEIEDGTNFIVIAKSNITGSMNFNNIVYFNEDKVRISGFNSGNAAFATADEYGRLNLVPPTNAKYFRYSVQGVYERLGIFFNVYSNNFNYYEYYSSEKSNWFNKKVVAFGDSLVYGPSNATNTWLSMLSKGLMFEPVNRGIGGSRVLQSDNTSVAWVADGSTDKTLGEYGEYVSRPSSLNDGSGSATSNTQPSGTVEITSSMCTDARVNTIPNDADAIIIIAGTNGMDESSYRLMLQKIYTRCPRAVVFCCSNTFRYNDAGKTEITNVNNNNNIIRNLCQEFGSHYIDLKGMEGVNQYNQSLYLSDNVHASNLGNEKRAMAIKSVLSNFEPLN